MTAFNIKVTEYGIKKGNEVVPAHYTWEYCVQKKIPYIIILPKIKYSKIDYDLMPVSKGLAFDEDHSIIEHWWKIYEEYFRTSNFPLNKIPLRITGVVTDTFTVFKKDQDRMLNLLMKEIEMFVNEYGIIDVERKKYYDETQRTNEMNW